jgi:hypothetical protein
MCEMRPKKGQGRTGKFSCQELSSEDARLDDLLMLNDTLLVVDPVGNHWVKFVVKQVAPSPERPHGISYALILHAADGERLVGYDNAHAVSAGSGKPTGRTRQSQA